MLYEQNHYTADQIKDAFLADNESFCPLEELIATSDAVFYFLRNLQMDMDTKTAFCQLEKQYDVYKYLVLNSPPAVD